LRPQILEICSVGKFAAGTSLCHCWANEWTQEGIMFEKICYQGQCKIQTSHCTCQWSIHCFLLLRSWNIPGSREGVFLNFVSEKQNSVLKYGKYCFLLWRENKLRVTHGKRFLELEARKVRQNESNYQCFYSRVLRTPANTVK
jgi:hypothetical protein